MRTMHLQLLPVLQPLPPLLTNRRSNHRGSSAGLVRETATARIQHDITGIPEMPMFIASNVLYWSVTTEVEFRVTIFCFSPAVFADPLALLNDPASIHRLVASGWIDESVYPFSLFLSARLFLLYPLLSSPNRLGRDGLVAQRRDGAFGGALVRPGPLAHHTCSSGRSHEPFLHGHPPTRQ